jgi:hypothetical protein
MRQSKPQQPRSNASHAKRLQHLAAAFAAFRCVNPRGRRIPMGLRRQVVTALDAGVSTSALADACGVSWSQATRWRSVAHASGVETAAPQVLSVVDTGAPGCVSSDGEIELRRALGISAASERRLSKDPLGPLSHGDGARRRSRRERLELDAARYRTLSAWHKELAKRHGRMLNAIRSKLMKMPVDPGLGEDERSEAEKAQDAAKVREHMARLKLGGGAQPAFESSKEAFMTGAQAAARRRPGGAPRRRGSGAGAGQPVGGLVTFLARRKANRPYPWPYRGRAHFSSNAEMSPQKKKPGKAPSR